MTPDRARQILTATAPDGLVVCHLFNADLRAINDARHGRPFETMRQALERIAAEETKELAP